MTRFRMLRPVAATVGVIGLVMGPASVAFGQEDVFVTNRESVQAFLNSDGSLDVARIYDQVDAFGTGTVRIENPVSTEGLRNLDGFGGYDVTDNSAVLDMEVDGDSAFRTVSDFTGELPVSVEPEYRLDGELVSPEDVVGKSGTLDVRITIRNTTAAPTDVSYFDANGDEVTESVYVPIPMVAIFETVLPPSFSSVETADYNVAGDGRGGTVLRANLVLFDGLPTGGSTATLFYTANISDGVIPEAQLDVVPVQPITHANFDGAYQASAQGMQSGRTLATGGARLEDGLGQLHDGASELLSGLQLIAEGTEQLRAGLADEAAPGSLELADGANQAANGAGELSAGLNNQLAPGARQLADGAQDAADGAGELSAGLNERLAPGARQLAEGARRLEQGLALLSSSLPDAHEGAGLLRAGVEGQILPGIRAVLEGLGDLGAGLDGFESLALAGVDASADSVIGGIDQLEGQVIAGLQQLSACVSGDLAICEPDEASRPPLTIQDGVRLIIAGLGMDKIPPDAPVDPDTVEEIGLGVWLVRAGLADAVADGGSVDALVGGLTLVEDGLADMSDQEWCTVECQTQVELLENSLAAVITSMTDADPAGKPGLKPSLEAARDGLTRVLGGLEEADSGLKLVDAGLSKLTQGIEGFQQLVAAGAEQFRGEVRSGADASRQRFAAGFDQVRNEAVAPLTSGVGQLEGGIAGELLGGLNELEDGLGSAVGGANELHDGSEQIASGNADLASGAGEAAGGANELASGLRDRLAPGAGQLANGANEAAAGARQLADGNRQIAEGAGELASGLGDAADGAGELADGTEEAAEGTPALVDGIGEARDGAGLLQAGGEDTVSTYAPTVALLQAANARGASEALPYGAPEGAIGTAAYSITLAGEAGEGGQNLVKAIAAIAILGLAAGGVALARRRATG